MMNTVAPVGLLCELPRLQRCCTLRGVCLLNLCFNETTILNLYSAMEHRVGRDFKYISVKGGKMQEILLPHKSTHAVILLNILIFVALK